MIWQTTRFQIDVSRPQVMGIVNVTPDSFFDGGNYPSTLAALQRCEALLRDGASLLDIGAESTRPGATPLPPAEELARLIPLVREVVKLGVPISVDSYKPQVMQAVLDLGVDIINDIWALRWQAAPIQANVNTGQSAKALLARHPNCGVCLMHMHREPQSMQIEPMEGDVVAQVISFLRDSAQELEVLGVQRNRIVIDPGIGFGKTAAQNFSLLAEQTRLLALGYPVVTGWSRKSSLADLGRGLTHPTPALLTHERLVPSVAAALLAVQRGSRIVRVHDVRETVLALQVLHALESNASTSHRQT